MGVALECLMSEGAIAVRVQGRESEVGRTGGGEWHWVARFTGLGTRLAAFGLLR